MFRELDIDLLQLSPRRIARGIPHPSPEEVDALRRYGVTRPLTARPLPDDPTRFEILSGETLWRAAQVVGLQRLPVFIPDDLTHGHATALLEGDDGSTGSPNPVARARALCAALRAAPGATRTTVAERLGLTLSSLSHQLRILELPPTVLSWMEEGKLTYGHGRVLLGLAHAAERVELARLVIRRRLSVRALERAVRTMIDEGLTPGDAVARTLSAGHGVGADRASRTAPRPSSERPVVSPEIRRLEQTLTDRLGSPVTLEHRGDGSGELRIAYHDLDVLDGILARLLPGEF